jgi:hypothetical protein
MKRLQKMMTTPEGRLTPRILDPAQNIEDRIRIETRGLVNCTVELTAIYCKIKTVDLAEYFMAKPVAQRMTTLEVVRAK